MRHPARMKPSNRPVTMLKESPRLKVGFVLMPRFTLTAFSTFLDVLRLAADEGDRSRPIACAWEVMSPRLQPIRSSCGIEIQPTPDLAAPGGGPAPGPSPAPGR